VRASTKTRPPSPPGPSDFVVPLCANAAGHDEISGKGVIDGTTGKLLENGRSRRNFASRRTAPTLPNSSFSKTVAATVLLERGVSAHEVQSHGLCPGAPPL